MKEVGADDPTQVRRYLEDWAVQRAGGAKRSVRDDLGIGLVGDRDRHHDPGEGWLES
jgi:hypothetical protein